MGLLVVCICNIVIPICIFVLQIDSYLLHFLGPGLFWYKVLKNTIKISIIYCNPMCILLRFQEVTSRNTKHETSRAISPMKVKCNFLQSYLYYRHSKEKTAFTKFYICQQCCSYTNKYKKVGTVRDVSRGLDSWIAVNVVLLQVSSQHSK